MPATQPTSRQLLGVNQQTYQSLIAALSLDLRRQLLIAVCDSIEMQGQIATQLERDIKQQIVGEKAAEAISDKPKPATLLKPMERLVFDADDGNLPQQIANWMRHTLFTVGDLPRLQVLGIEQMTRQPAITQNYFLRSLDKIEALLPQLNTSLLVWVPWPWLRTIQQSSSTFWNWRNGLFEFVSDPTPTPANREGQGIDVTLLEPERQSSERQSPQSSHQPSETLPKALAEKLTQMPRKSSDTQTETATLNGSSSSGPLSNGRGKSADNGAVKSAEKANRKDADADEQRDRSNAVKSAATTAANSSSASDSRAVDLSNFFDLQSLSPTQGSAHQQGSTTQGSTASSDRPVEPQLNVSEAAQSEDISESDALFEATETDAHSNEPMPLEFWDDDDFPIFNSDLAFESNIEREVEKLDELESTASAQAVSTPASAEDTPDAEMSDAEMSDAEMSDAEMSDAEMSDAETPTIQAPDNQNSIVLDHSNEAVDKPVSGDLSIAAPDKTDLFDIEANQKHDFVETVASTGNVAEAAETEDRTSHTVSQQDASQQSASQQDTDKQSAAQKHDARKKKSRQRNLLALSGLRSVVSQGVNVSARAASAPTLPSADAEDTTGAIDNRPSSSKEDPAALLDALPQQTTDDEIAHRSLAGAPASADVPVVSIDSLAEPLVESSANAVQVIEKRSLTQPLAVAEPEDTLPNEDEAVEALPAEAPPAEKLPVEKPLSEKLSEHLEAGAQDQAAQHFAEGLAYRSRIEAGEKGLTVIEPAIAAYERGLAYLRDFHPDRITGLNDLGTLYWLKAQRQSQKAEAIACMKKSIQLYRDALAQSSEVSDDRSSGDVPSAQAGIISQLHSNMGAVFTMLATCEDPVHHLTQAAQSYQQALPMMPLAQSPEDYATLQNSLGSVFWKLSHYESVELYLHQAIAAYTEALSGYDPQKQPLDYAAVQNNLGITYWSLAKHEQPEMLLKRAITAYRDALNYRTSDVDAAACAISYNNLALAYWDLSKHTHSDLAQKSRYQKNAVTAFEAALNINNLSGALSPMDSAAIYHCLGDVHAQMTETAPSTVDIADSLQKSLYSYVKSIENLSTDSPAYPPRFGAIVANLRLHYEKLGLEGQQNALNRIPSTLLPQVMMAL